MGQGREFRIRRLLKGLTGYDVVIVDTSPVLTPLNVAILYAVAEILIPIDPCVAALAGVRALEDLVRTVSEFRLEFTDAGPLDHHRRPDHAGGPDPGLQADRGRGPELLRPARLSARGPGLGQVPGSLRAGDPADPLRSVQRGSRGVPRRGRGLPQRRRGPTRLSPIDARRHSRPRSLDLRRSMSSAVP